jgi:MSHA biogenesis protein MshL
MENFSIVPVLLALSACGALPLSPSPVHIREAVRAAGEIPQVVQQSATLRPPKAAPKVETYSVTVYKVQVQSLLFALARDAKLNVDIHPGIEGSVTLNALDQTLPQLLNRIAKQIDMRYELDGANLTVLPDGPFLRNYKIDYVNISRNTSSTINIATQIAAGSTNAAGGGAAGGDNNSTTTVTNTSNNHFWEVLRKNIEDILRETDKVIPEGGGEQVAAAPPTPPVPLGAPVALLQKAKPVGYREAASVIANPETGLIAVRASGRQHEKIQEFLDLVMSSAKRQVLIEATIVEVQLSDQFQQGINWSSVNNKLNSAYSLKQGQVGSRVLESGVLPGVTPGMVLFNFLKAGTALGDISATIQLLDTFGKVKVLSSPKISVLNNQTALLKVVDNNVYFTISADVTPATKNSFEKIVYTSQLHTVPVGFVMSVTPQIADSDEVTLNVRPTITRIVSYVQDPNPVLAAAGTVSNIPVIQARELESIMKVGSGQVAVMGGLMQDSISNVKDSIPGVAKVPILGNLFGYRNEKTTKSELVVFIRPVVLKDPSLNGDFKDYRYLMPDGVSQTGAQRNFARPAREAGQ